MDEGLIISKSIITKCIGNDRFTYKKCFKKSQLCTVTFYWQFKLSLSVEAGFLKFLTTCMTKMAFKSGEAIN